MEENTQENQSTNNKKIYYKGYLSSLYLLHLKFRKVNKTYRKVVIKCLLREKMEEYKHQLL